MKLRMDFLAWHYTYAQNYYLRRYIYFLEFVSHYFSLPILITSLFAPYKRLVTKDTSSGFNLQKAFEVTSYNLVSRLIGSIVRLSLLFIGSISLVLAAFLGAFAYPIWFLLPPFSLGLYQRYSQNPVHLSHSIFEKIKNSQTPLTMFLQTQPGEFIIRHLNTDLKSLSSAAKEKQIEPTPNPKSIKDLASIFVSQNFWSSESLRKLGATSENFLSAALWWDRKWENKISPDVDPPLGSPGLGLELLHGYTPTLTELSVDLATPQEFTHRLIGREDVVRRIERVLGSDNNAILVGEPGVGKRTILLEFARRSRNGELGKKMAYKRILEFDHNFLLSESVDLNKKKVKLSQALEEAELAGNVILVIRDLHRLTNSALEGFDFTEILEKHLEKRNLKIIAISTPQDYEKYLSKNARLRKYFETIKAEEVDKDAAMEILIESADNWESKRPLTITVQSLSKIINDSDRFITEAPFPEKAIEILDSTVALKEQETDSSIITEKDVSRVMEERTGVPFEELSKQKKSRLGNLEETIHKSLVNQETAVNQISKILRAKSVKAIKSKRPIGSFLFLGPTGVGKTETAKVLADVYFGNRERILRFDMAEYASAEGLERLIGSQRTGNPGALTTAIKNNPASLLLLDEIEKAPPEVFNLFLTILDEGQITDALNTKINAQNLFIIATSNAGAEKIRELVGKGTTAEELQKEIIEHVLKTQIFSPEFINRFDGTIVYSPLTKEHLIKVAKLMFDQFAENLKIQGIYIETNRDVWEKLANDGYEPEFGARPMRRVLELSVGDTIGKAILAEEISPGDHIKLTPGQNKNEYNWEKISP